LENEIGLYFYHSLSNKFLKKVFVSVYKRGTDGALKRREDWVYVVTEKEGPISTSRLLIRFEVFIF